mmetsp:Transcript_28480/g.53380  ORF Transcript_28480/g.53380 Transcript_28480/m.53380 type:complete len:257 (-) Transcript_28480:104-874(-)
MFNSRRACLEVLPNLFVFLLETCGPVGLKLVQVVGFRAVVVVHAPILGALVATPSVTGARQCVVVSYASSSNAVPAAAGSYGEDIDEVVAQPKLLKQSLAFHPLVDQLHVLLPAGVDQVLLTLQVRQDQLSVEAPAACAGNFRDLAHDLAVKSSKNVAVLVRPLHLLKDGQEPVEDGRDRRQQLCFGRPDSDALSRSNGRRIKAVDVVRLPVETGDVPPLNPSIMRSWRWLTDDLQGDDRVAVTMGHLRGSRGHVL